MRKSIDGKIYNTETAVLVCEDSRGSYPGSGDCSGWSAELYRTPKGAFFLVGGGGGMTQFARHCDGGGTCGDSGVFRVITSEEARAFAERAGLDVDTLGKYFPLIDA